MTSNIGTELIQDQISNLTSENRDSLMSEIRRKIIDILRRKMRPEFLNRIDEIILFKPLIEDEIKQIANLNFNLLKQKMKTKGIDIEITDDALDWLTKLGYDKQFGARPLKRAMQKYIADPLALKLLASQVITGSKIIIDSNEQGGFVFSESKES